MTCSYCSFFNSILYIIIQSVLCEQTLGPIFEAQFFAHSYGFWPMRDAPMALERAKELVFNTGYYWIVEGDINKCFDRIDQSFLPKAIAKILGAMIHSCTNSEIRLSGFFAASSAIAVFSLAMINLMLSFLPLSIWLLLLMHLCEHCLRGLPSAH